jgi:hypothetical protein
VICMNFEMMLFRSLIALPLAFVQAYPHASSVIQSLGESDINVNLLVQVDKLVRLLETPIFSYLRLQVTLLHWIMKHPIFDNIRGQVLCFFSCNRVVFLLW